LYFYSRILFNTRYPVKNRSITCIWKTFFYYARTSNLYELTYLGWWRSTWRPTSRLSSKRWSWTPRIVVRRKPNRSWAYRWSSVDSLTKPLIDRRHSDWPCNSSWRFAYVYELKPKTEKFCPRSSKRNGGRVGKAFTFYRRRWSGGSENSFRFWGLRLYRFKPTAFSFLRTARFGYADVRNWK